MALKVIPHQPLSFEVDDQNHVQKLKTNAVGICNPYFIYGITGWSLELGIHTDSGDGYVELSAAAAPSNSVIISQTVKLVPGTHTLIIDYELLNAAIGGVTLNVTDGSQNENYTLPTGVANYEEAESINILNDAEYTITLTFTFANPSEKVNLTTLNIYDISDSDRISFQVKALPKTVNLIDSTIPLTPDPVIETTNSTPQSFAYYNVVSTFFDSKQYGDSFPTAITENGKYLIRSEFTGWNLQSAECRISGSDNEVGKVGLKFAFITPSFDVERCTESNKDEFVIDLEVGHFINSALVAYATLNGSSQYDLVHSWTSATVKVYPMWVVKTKTLEEGLYKLCFDLENIDSVRVKIVKVSTGTVLFQSSSSAGTFNKNFNIVDPGDYEIRIEFDDEIIDDAKLINTCLYKLCQPAALIVDINDNVIAQTDGFNEAIPVTIGNESTDNFLINHNVIGMPEGCYRVQLYDKEVDPIEILMTSNIFRLQTQFDKESILFKWTSGYNIRSGKDCMLKWDGTFWQQGYKPIIRLDAEILKPFNEEAREVKEHQNGCLINTFIQQRTIRTLQIVNYLPEYQLMALFIGFMHETFLIDEVEYQKVNNDDLSPEWQDKFQKAPVRILIHRIGDHFQTLNC